MRPIIEGPPEEGEAPRPLAEKLLWFVALWVGSAAMVAIVAYALRAFLF